jgi:hypothetical protein
VRLGIHGVGLDTSRLAVYEDEGGDRGIVSLEVRLRGCLRAAHALGPSERRVVPALPPYAPALAPVEMAGTVTQLSRERLNHYLLSLETAIAIAIGIACVHAQ